MLTKQSLVGLIQLSRVPAFQSSGAPHWSLPDYGDGPSCARLDGPRCANVPSARSGPEEVPVTCATGRLAEGHAFSPRPGSVHQSICGSGSASESHCVLLT